VGDGHGQARPSSKQPRLMCTSCVMPSARSLLCMRASASQDRVQMGYRRTGRRSSNSLAYWGPPNFGEHPRTDSKFTAWIVSVGKPVPVQAGVQFAGKSQASVSEIQLSIDPTTFHSKVLRPLDGKMVVATGKFWQASTPGDVTPVVLSVETLAATDKTICRVTPDD